MTPRLRVVPDLAEAGAAEFLALGPRTLALAGGRTPRALYERLRACDYPWHEVDVFFGDERCVPEDHPDSNLRMAREALLDHVPARVHPLPGATCGADAAERELQAVFGPGVPRFDLVLLGLGADGHTASLFPGDPALGEGERRVVRVARADHPRLTLTLPVLSAARAVVFLVAGAEKRDALAALIRGDDIPAARVTAASVLVLTDESAAGRPADRIAGT